MQLNIHEQDKYISIWLTKAEAIDDEIRESLKPLYQEYKEKKYRVVVFESGNGDLALLTSDLLQHAIENSAEKLAS